MAMDDEEHQLLLSHPRKTQVFWVLSIIKWLLKIKMCIILIAWVSLFFLIPSSFGADLYTDWVDATDSTLFGETGSALLLYSGPVLIIAVLAIPYLLISSGKEEEDHLQEKKKKSPRFRLWTFPVLVDGPFGVVSAAELLVIILFPAFVLWAIYEYTLSNYRILPSYGDLTDEEAKLFMLQMSAYCFGLITLSCLAFLFLPIARGSILLRLIDIPFEHATKYHVWLGNFVMFLATVHGSCYIILWMFRGILWKELIEWKSDGGANFAGVFCYLFGLIMWITTLPYIRKRYFELFFYTHQLYIFFVIFLALHIGGTNFSKAAGGIFIFMLDRFLRFCQSRRKVNIVSATSFSCGAIKLVLSKPENLQYNALGFIFIRIRELSKLQWHPFSISSSPLDGKHHLSVLIKVMGGWTSKLKASISGQSQIDFSKITPFVEGPYGHESPYYLTYENLILVAGGSGISPFLAILSDILHRIKEGKFCLPRNVLIIWAVKKSNELSLLYSTNMESSFSYKLDLQIEAFVTRELDPPLPSENGEYTRPVVTHHNPVSSSNSMSVLVGTGNIIWAGLYVIISALGFLIIIGLLDVFYINPYSITAWWYNGILLLGCMVFSVILFGGAVVVLWHFWEQRISTRVIDHRNGEDITTVGHNEEDQMLASSSNIMYGCRPDFKEIFGSVSKRWGNVDVGVIVCGPPTLQTSVARECRSHSLRRRRKEGEDVPIFHFNSHSFDL